VIAACRLSTPGVIGGGSSFSWPQQAMSLPGRKEEPGATCHGKATEQQEFSERNWGQ
jgi:hypothetical protein